MVWVGVVAEQCVLLACLRVLLCVDEDAIAQRLDLSWNRPSTEELNALVHCLRALYLQPEALSVRRPGMASEMHMGCCKRCAMLVHGAGPVAVAFEL